MKKDFGRGSAEQFINVLERKIQQLGGTVESACNTCNIPANPDTLDNVYASDNDEDPMFLETYSEVLNKLAIEGYNPNSQEVANYAYAAAEYIQMAREADGNNYTVEEWYNGTKMNYPEDLAELPVTSSQDITAADDAMPSDEDMEAYLDQLTSKVTSAVNELGLSISFASENNGNDIVCYVYEYEDDENIDEYTIPMDDLTLDISQIDTDVEYILEAIQGNTDTDYASINSDSGFTEIASKQVTDSDGFLTDYTMYRDTTTGEYVFVFGDKDMYSPNDGDFDWSCDTEEEAWDWFNDYTGISE